MQYQTEDMAALQTKMAETQAAIPASAPAARA